MTGADYVAPWDFVRGFERILSGASDVDGQARLLIGLMRPGVRLVGGWG